MREEVDFVEFRMEPRDWLRGLILMAAGKTDVAVGVSTNGGFDNVEIIGKLPQTLRKGLRRYHLAREIGDEPDFALTWRTKSDGFGPTFAIESLDDVIGLVVKRKRFLAKEATARK